MIATELVDALIEGHGGRARWRAVDSIEAALSSGGLAFALKWQPFALRWLQAVVRPHAREVTLYGYGRPEWRGIWTPDEVRLVDAGGDTVARRTSPRQAFARSGRVLRWDALDMLYFAGYALWNYLSFPFLLEAPGVTAIEKPAAGPPGSRLIEAWFDDGVPTHSRVQRFHVDASLRLVRHDYTADVLGRFATAANFCRASQVVDGLRFYTRRRVVPRFGPELVLPLPTLVWIELDSVRVRFLGGSGPPSAPG